MSSKITPRLNPSLVFSGEQINGFQTFAHLSIGSTAIPVGSIFTAVDADGELYYIVLNVHGERLLGENDFYNYNKARAALSQYAGEYLAVATEALVAFEKALNSKGAK